MATNIKFYEDQPHTLAGAGVSLGDTSMVLSSFVGIDGTLLTMSNFGVIGFGTVEQGTPREEAIAFTGVTQNMDGTATLTGITHVTFGYPYTQTSGFAKSHAGSTFFVISNNPGLLDTMANKQNDGTIIAQWTFNALANNANPKIDSNSYTFTALDYITKGYADGASGYLRLDGTNQMLANLNFGGFRGVNAANPINPQDVATKLYVDQSIAAGGVPADIGVAGLVNIATQAEFDNVVDTQVIGGLTYYNMATISQIKQVGSSLFTYGEDITALEYVYQATGNEVKILAQSGSPSVQISASSTWVGSTFTAIANYTNLTGYKFNLTSYISNSPLSGTITVQLYALSGGLPTGSALATSSTTGVGFGSHTVTFSPYALTAGTQYGIVVNFSGVSGLAPGLGGNTVQLDGAGSFETTNSGSTWTSLGGVLGGQISVSPTVGEVYKVDITTPVLNIGPYKGFAKTTASAGTTNAVQLINTIGGFTSLTPAGNVYIDASTPGGITQTESGNGRAVGIAINSTTIQLIDQKKMNSNVSYTLGNTVNKNGFLLGTLASGGTGGASVVEIDPFGNQSTLFSVSANTSCSVTIPVKVGYSYNKVSANTSSLSLVFSELING